MLGRTYRFVVLNSCGQTLGSNPVTIKARRWNFSSSGLQSWEAAEASIDTTIANALTNGSYSAGNSNDNSSNAYLGGTFKVSVTSPASASGTISVYLQRSTDGGTTWPDNGNGTLIRVFAVGASTTYTDEIEL